MKQLATTSGTKPLQSERTLQSVEEIIFRFQPVGFLEQLGKQLKTIVGLNHHKTETNGDLIRIQLLVKTCDRSLGTYFVAHDKLGLWSTAYTGFHPVGKRKGVPEIACVYEVSEGTRYDTSRKPLRRGDGWKQIIFPGFID